MYFIEKVIINDVSGKPIIRYNVYYENRIKGYKHLYVKSYTNKNYANKFCYHCNKAINGDI